MDVLRTWHFILTWLILLVDQMSMRLILPPPLFLSILESIATLKGLHYHQECIRKRSGIIHWAPSAVIPHKHCNHWLRFQTHSNMTEIRVTHTLFQWSDSITWRSSVSTKIPFCADVAASFRELAKLLKCVSRQTHTHYDLALSKVNWKAEPGIGRFTPRSSSQQTSLIFVWMMTPYLISIACDSNLSFRTAVIVWGLFKPTVWKALQNHKISLPSPPGGRRVAAIEPLWVVCEWMTTSVLSLIFTSYEFFWISCCQSWHCSSSQRICFLRHPCVKESSGISVLLATSPIFVLSLSFLALHFWDMVI